MLETMENRWSESVAVAQRGSLEFARRRDPVERMVLVVEDDEDIAEMLCYALVRKGVRVAVAHDGLTAMALAENLRPDLMLLDVMLPRLDGLAVCRSIRGHQDRELARLPVVMLSALSTPDDIERGMAVGANAYFCKPYTVRDVVAATLEWLG
ncbi:MAG: response regulator transcription factor [Thermodesulfobacteriota bacterium]